MSNATDQPDDGAIDGFEGAMAYLRHRADLERSVHRAADAGRAFTLDRMHALAAALGDPHRSYRCVHVAGSKGKGSVCEMLAAALKACGCAVGLYTSPHLIDLRERIRIGGRMITKAQFTAAMAAVQAAERSLPEGLRPVTHFEALTAAALVHFREQAVDIAIIETGLGGLLDATNILRPDVCAITAIQLEHTDVLGTTLAEIARHKAGIIKAHVPVLTLRQERDVLGVIRERAEALNSPLGVVGECIPVVIRQLTDEPGSRARVTIRTSHGEIGPVEVPYPGEHQAMNCALALAVLDRVRDLGLRAPWEKIAAGIAATPSHGRMELVSKSPRIVIDGAHTPESVRAAMDAIGSIHPHDSLIVVFGCATDKDARAMLAEIARAADKVILTAAANPRAVPPGELFHLLPHGSHGTAQTSPDVRRAIKAATASAGAADLVLVMGSFAIAGEAKLAVRV